MHNDQGHVRTADASLPLQASYSGWQSPVGRPVQSQRSKALRSPPGASRSIWWCSAPARPTASRSDKTPSHTHTLVTHTCRSASSPSNVLPQASMAAPRRVALACPSRPPLSRLSCVHSILGAQWHVLVPEPSCGVWAVQQSSSVDGSTATGKALRCTWRVARGTSPAGRCISHKRAGSTACGFRGSCRRPCSSSPVPVATVLQDLKSSQGLGARHDELLMCYELPMWWSSFSRGAGPRTAGHGAAATERPAAAGAVPRAVSRSPSRSSVPGYPSKI